MSIATQATEWNCSNEDYHSDVSAVGHSMLEVLRESPAVYHARFIAKSLPPEPPTASMILGTLFHICVLEPERWENRASKEPDYPPAPEFGPDGKKWLRRKGSDHEKAWNEYEASIESMRAQWAGENVGKLVVPANLVEAAEGMAAAVWANKHAKMILDRCQHREFSLRWADPETGLELKSRCDALGEFLPDLKSAGDIRPQQFLRSVERYGYHRQAHLYQDGAEAYTGERLPHAIICTTNEKPYRAAVHVIETRTLALGGQQVRFDLEDLARRIEHQDWVDDCCKQVNQLDLNNWAFTEDRRK